MTRFFTPCVAAPILLLLIACTPAFAADAPSFELKDGDRIALIGGTFIEREQSYSHLETLLRTRWPDRKLSFRNLGWSGDNVFGASRGYFEGADAGFARLTKIAHDVKPNIIFIGYGMTESFDGEPGLPAFRSGLEKMLDMLKDLNARETVLIGPIQHEKLGTPFPDPAQHNASLRAYADAMKDIASTRGLRFVDLYDLTAPKASTPPRTSNGIHLTAAGYWQAAQAIQSQLGLPAKEGVSVNDRGEIVGADAEKDNAVRLEKMRQLAIQKNVQFFNQWRPANETYIFGFRAYEQGKNAAEMPKFTQPIEALEAEMMKLAQLIEK